MKNRQNNKAIPVVFVTDNSFLIPTATVIFMMKENKNKDTKYHINVIVVDCENEAASLFETLQSEDCKIEVISSNLNEFEDIVQISHISKAALLIFKIPELLRQYDKILYLDGDIIVRGDLSELYNIELEDQYLSGIADIESVGCNRRIVNSGVLVMNLKKMRECGVTQKLITTRANLGNIGSMDQKTLNLVLKGYIKFLPVKYNCVAIKLIGYEKRNYPIQKVNELFETNYANNQKLVEDAIIIHFATNGKPWKYKYIPCATEWYDYYQRAPFEKPVLQRISEIEAHLIGLKRIIKTKGLRGLVNRIKEYVLIFTGKQPPISGWG